jgi:hypothetical protein
MGMTISNKQSTCVLVLYDNVRKRHNMHIYFINFNKHGQSFNFKLNIYDNYA